MLSKVESTASQGRSKSNNPKVRHDGVKTGQPERKKTHHLTAGRHVKERSIRTMEEEISKPYRVPELKSVEEVKKFWEHEKEKKAHEMKAHCSKRHTFGSRLKLSWKSERLFVPDDFTLPGSSVTDDIDPTFFTMVEGRPIKEKMNARKYVRDVRNCFMTRLKMGFYLDEVLLMGKRHLNEKQKLAQVRGRFLLCLKGFETFLKEDHESSSTLLEKAKEEAEKSKTKLKMITDLKEELKKLSAVVLSMEEEWRNLKMYQKFLLLISPPEWRKVNDAHYGKEDDERVNRSDLCLFDSFREVPSDESADLESRISKFEEGVRESPALVLYFENPQQVLNVLAELEKNNMRALVYSKELDFPAEKMAAELEKARIRFAEEQTILEEEVKFLRCLIEEEENGAKSSEVKLRRVAFGLFHDLITDEEYLSATVYVEDAYEDAVALNDSDLDLLAMIKEIELKHESLLLALDCLPTDIVTRSTRQFYKAQKREMKEAEEAERKVHQMDILLKRLSKALAPPKRFVPRRITARSLPPEELMFKFEPPKTRSKEEKDSRFFFEEAPENVRLYKPLCL